MGKFNPKARHSARCLALQGLYQWQMTGENVANIKAQLLREKNPKEVDFNYFAELIEKIPGNIDRIDQYMKKYLDRDFSELNPVETAAMRIGIYELIERLEIPYRVVINEALEITKTFGAVEGYKYVNGILDKVAHEVRNAELQK